MYQATVVKVMIASPSDVVTERRIIRDVIDQWNAINAEDRKVVLMPVGWETHSSPDMSDRAQAIINRDLLKDADLLVAVFWTRLGSPTGTSPSGTVEEIEEHLEAEKPTLIYFSSAPVRPDSVDDAQYSALKEFKESCKARGLIAEYENLTDFRDKFWTHLSKTVIDRFTNEPTDVAVVETLPDRPIAPTLSDAARQLLLEAAQDPNGVIMRIGHLGGTAVQTNKRNFVEPGNVRSGADWRSAVDELHRLSLIEDRGGKGEVFFVTGEGYQMVDLLKQE